MARKALDEIVGRIEEIPTLRQVASRLLEIIDNPESKIEEVNRIVTQDPPLAAKLLRLVNSAYMGLGARIASLRQAIVLLGFNMVRTMALSISVFEAFSDSESPTERARERIWEHSITTSNMCQLIAQHDTDIDGEIAFALGLLHDMGKLVLDSKAHQEWGQIISLMNRRELTFHEAEQQVLRTDHAEIGAWVAEQWRLQEELVTGIRQHHRPLAWRTSRQFATLRLANVLSREPALEHPESVLDNDALIEVCRHLRIGSPRLLKLASACYEKRTQANQFIQALSN